MTINLRPRVGTDFHKKFKFTVDLDGFNSMAWQKCSELKSTLNKVSYREGGSTHAVKSPGLVEYEDITLERGVCGDYDLYRWMKEVSNARMHGKGVVYPHYKRSGKIYQYDRDDTVLNKWIIIGAWPTEFVAGDWDNEADEVVIEKCVLCIDYFYLVNRNGSEV